MKMKACYRIRRMPCSMAICSSAEVVQFRKYLLCAVTCQGLCWLLGISQFSHWVISNSFRPHGLQHTRLPCPSPSPGACSNSCPLSLWCHPTIEFSVTCFSCPWSFLVSGSFPMSQLFTSGGQSTGISITPSVLAMNIQGWLPLDLTALISLLSKGLSRVFSSTTIWKHQFFGA